MSEVVVGVDASPAGRAALRWALREAAVGQHALTAVRAWDLASYDLTALALLDHEPAARAHALRLAEQQLRAAVGELDGTAPLSACCEVRPGPVAKVLVERSRDADLLVVGTRGPGPVGRTVLGSVSAAVLGHARVPVVAVPEPPEGAPSALRRVLVGVDGSPPSLAALGFAARVARTHRVPLAPVLAHPDVADLTIGEGHRGGVAQPKASERTHLLVQAQQQGTEGLDVQPEVGTGHAADVLLHLSGPGDLVVVGARHRPVTAAVLGSTGLRLVQHATCPVAIVHAD